MFPKNKILLFLIILVISRTICTIKYSILNNKTFVKNQSIVRIIRSFNNRDLINCLSSCSEISDCDGVSKTDAECQLINILTDSNLIQDNQVKIFLKKNSLKFGISYDKISKILIYNMLF